jgi:3-hydroxyisobutyrate dehydrogenase
MPGIAFIGIGRMGLPVCANLVAAGYDVCAADTRPEREAAARQRGARWRGQPKEAAAGAGVVITMLPGPREVREAMAGPAGVLVAMAPEATWIDMTSNSPAAGRELAAEARCRGIGVLDAPAGGGISAATAGTLQLFVGGDGALLQRCRPLLEVIAEPGRIVHVGASGAGYTAKLLVNLLWFDQAVATAEALLIGRRAGIDPDVLRQAMAGSAASGAFVQNDLEALLGGDYLTSFGLDRCCEELAAAVALARELQAPCELAEVVERTYRRALLRYGPVDGELLGVSMLEEDAGLRLRH